MNYDELPSPEKANKENSPAEFAWVLPPSEATARLEPLPRPKRLWLAVLLFLATFATCVAMGRQFALAFERGEAADLGEISVSLKLLYKDPTALAPGVSFALALLGILLVHELGHYFACRYHKIRASYPYFIPFPSLIGTLGAFILMRSPIRSRRALFDVGASGPLAGFCVAVPVLIWGVAHSRVVPGLASENAQVVFGAPLALRLLARWFFPGANPLTLLLHPVGRAAWVGLFATALNLLPMGQLDGGHVLRSVNARLHRWAGWLVPAALVLLGYFEWPVWWMWAAILLGLRFLRIPPVQDQRPLDSTRLVLAIITLLVMLLCFMPAPIS